MNDTYDSSSCLSTTPTTTTFVNSLTIDRSKPVLVTGATGYIAGVLIQTLLEYGVTVHATVRDVTNTSSYQHLQNFVNQPSQPQQNRWNRGTIHFFSADLLIDGSFEDAMKQCSIVFHTASPCVLVVTDAVHDLIDPAVKGTRNVLNTATRTPSVTKVVLTSSTAAISGGAADGYDPAIVHQKNTDNTDSTNGTYNTNCTDSTDSTDNTDNTNHTTNRKNPALTEDNWNRTSTLQQNPYAYSKTLAELTAWTIAGSQTQWKLVTINPALVLGPGVKYHDTSSSYKAILALAGNWNNLQLKFGVPSFAMGVVDVRDVAQAHIHAAYSTTATGRYICVGHNSSLDQIAAALRSKFSPRYYPIPTFQLSLPRWFWWLIAPYVANGLLTRTYVWKHLGLKTNFDMTKSQMELDLHYRPLEETVCDMYQQLIDLKIVQSRNDTIVTSNLSDGKKNN